MNGHLILHECWPVAHKLSLIKQEVIILYKSDLDSRGLALRLNGVQNMSNFILETKGGKHASKLRAHRLVQCQLKLNTRFNLDYEFQRALYEDLEALGAWLWLIKNMRAKYEIVVSDFSNFDETRFMKSFICPVFVITLLGQRGRGKGAQPGNQEWGTENICINSGGYNVPPFWSSKGRNTS